MMRRVGVTLVFAMLGLISLLLADAAHSWLCLHVSGFCRQASGPCPDIDVCTPGALRSLVLFAVYFGPSIVFGMAGFFFSKKPRSAFAWGALLVGLVSIHSVMMIAAIQATTR